MEIQTWHVVDRRSRQHIVTLRVLAGLREIEIKRAEPMAWEPFADECKAIVGKWHYPMGVKVSEDAATIGAAVRAIFGAGFLAVQI